MTQNFMRKGSENTRANGISLLRTQGALSFVTVNFRRAEGVRNFCRRYCRNAGAVTAFICLLMLVNIAVCAPYLAPYEPMDISPKALLSPQAAHIMGTDDLGRDVFSGLVYGTRVSLGVGFLAALTAAIIGVLVGSISGYYGGKTDQLLMRLTELFQVLPQFFLAILIIALLGPGIEKVVVVIGVLSWPNIARLVRAEFMSLREREFVTAVLALGAKPRRVIWGHILPNACAPAVVATSLGVGRAILTEANLSFFGLGDPDLISWGQMLNNAQSFLQLAWWLAVFPGLAILVTVLAANLVGDGLNEALNPQLRGR